MEFKDISNEGINSTSRRGLSGMCIISINILLLILIYIFIFILYKSINSLHIFYYFHFFII